MKVAVVAIGDEILAGDTLNTNANWLAGRLGARGVRVERMTVIPDRIDEIAAVVGEYAERYDAVLTTGGLGPTHDDLTMEGVAAAFGIEVEENEEALRWLTEEGGYARDDLTTGTADLPADARPLHNDAGVAPGAVVENVYVLPGVPSEMEAMFESIEAEFEGEATYSRSVVTSEPESGLLDRIEEVRERFDVAIGSYPSETVRLKVSGTDEAAVEAAVDWLVERVDVVEEPEE
ncbi:competence/damage-inducible protein A [Natronorarus salvus]|uniref:competence/damage-inducible protein A n=1 Tax=Natronorarus salvus TaxID=3117733 RepID=UPI002F262606